MLLGSNERWEATAVSFLLFQNEVYSSKDERLACFSIVSGGGSMP